MAYIEIRNLNYTYPEEKTKTLNNINLEINKGEVLFIAGNSGSGKSTLAKCITGAIPMFYGGTIGGEVLIDGEEITKLEHKKRAALVTMVFQDPERQLVMNKVHREIAFGLENIGVEGKDIKRRVWESMEFSNIMELAYKDVNNLSGGQKQRVAIASALAFLPQCIILDEPSSQLDPSSKEEVVHLIKKINEELGISIIVIEQRINRWFEVADRVVVLKDGNIYFNGSKEEMYNSNDSYIDGFLPTGLRLAKAADVLRMPESFKKTRDALKNINFDVDDLTSYGKGDSIIKIKGLCCKYEDNVAIKSMDLIINEGDFTGIIGANGAGKSTLLKAIMGLIKYKGSIKVKDNEVSRMKTTEIAKIIGYVSQNPNDYISRDTVYDEIKFTLDNYKIKDNGEIEGVLKSLDIYKLRDKNPRDLSGGEKQRLALATILVLNPNILLLDEPTRGLDYEAKQNLGEILIKLKKSGTTIILVTHDIDFSAQFCSNFVLMFNGEVAAKGSTKEVLKDGIYYTTDIYKLLKGKTEDIYTLNQALAAIRR